MKILLVNQCFHPDVVSSAQHLTDLAKKLASSGHQVTVLAGKRGYDNPRLRFPRHEVWNGITICRIPSTGMGKGSSLSRAVDFGSFMICCFAQMLLFPRFDAVVAMTSPPLISFFAALIAAIKRERFYFWIMDMNPDEAIAAGLLRENSRTARILKSMLMYGISKARKLIVLDRFMKRRLLERGASADNIAVIPPWSHDQQVFFDRRARGLFRASHDLTDKFVVMYSGNHSPCHPLNTLLKAAVQLGHHPEIVFLFVGGGSEFGKAKLFVQHHGLNNCRFLPYQPLDRLSESISSADLHVAVMGNAFTGIVHPCKIYNILSVGRPFLYIGPEESHIADIIRELGDGAGVYSAKHGEVGKIADIILEAQRQAVEGECQALQKLSIRYSASILLPQMVHALECSPDSSVPHEIVWDSMRLGLPQQ